MLSYINIQVFAHLLCFHNFVAVIVFSMFYKHYCYYYLLPIIIIIISLLLLLSEINKMMFSV